MNWTGLIAAIGTFLLIGSFHVIVIKTEYYFGKQVWPVFAGIGIFSLHRKAFYAAETER